MAVASFQPPTAIYREEQNFDWWVYAALGLFELFVGASLIALERKGVNPIAGGPLGALAFSSFVLAGLGSPILLLVVFLRMTTEVTPTTLRVWFGFFPSYRRTVPIDSIRRVEVVSYRPLAEYGGWGVRIGRNGERVLSARGNRGVRVELADGTLLLIGSQRPEPLAIAIEGALLPGV